MIVAIAAAMVSLAIYGLSKSKDPYFEMNVEALCDPESGGFGPMRSKTGTPGKYHMKLCSSCSGTFGDYDMDVVAYCPN